MTDITSTSTIKVGFLGFKIAKIVTPTTAGTGDTLDMNIDSTDGVTQYFNKVHAVMLQDIDGTTIDDCTWNNTTGVITLPSVTTGQHQLIVFGD